MGNTKHERTCIVCSKKYKYCHRCGEYNPDETWRYMFCDENCRQIFKVCGAFSFNEISAYEARELLDQCDLSNKVRNNQIINNIDEIYGGAN